ncbi:ATP-dependent zinc metalloprotease FtsH [subsurface metagenome]
MGYVITLPEEDRFLKSKRELIDNITQLLGGRVSEEMNFNDITSGAQNDLDRATKITRKMIMEYGMSKRLGPITFKGEEEEVFLGKEIASGPHYSDQIASAIDEEVHNIVMDSYEMARKILLKNKKTLADLANELIEKETLSRDEILKVLSKVESKKSKRVEQLEEKSEVLNTRSATVKTIKEKAVKATSKK